MTTNIQEMAVTKVPAPYISSDYTQWERKKRPATSYNTTIHHLSSLCQTRKQQCFTVPRGTTASRPLDSEHTRLLKLQIKGKRKSLQNYRQHCNKLQSQNEELIADIQRRDDTTHSSVTVSIEKYHKFKDVLNTMRHKVTIDLKHAKTNLNETIKSTQLILQNLENEVQELEDKLDISNHRLQILKNYKEREYPLKLVQAEQLRIQLEYLDEIHQREVTELEGILQEESDKFNKKMEKIRTQLETEASEKWLNQMRRSIFARAVHNKIIEKEVELHQRKEHQLHIEISAIQAKIKGLTEYLHQNPSHKLPLETLGKCMPDTDIKLDIPVYRELPV